jgi:hypothetical protein
MVVGGVHLSSLISVPTTGDCTTPSAISTVAQALNNMAILFAVCGTKLFDGNFKICYKEELPLRQKCSKTKKSRDASEL